MPARTDEVNADAPLDERSVARWYDARSEDDGDRGGDAFVPTGAPRAARALPIASVSVHAASHAVTGQRVSDGQVRRLSFARASALADRSPWDAVKHQPVGMGTGAAPITTLARTARS